MTWVFAILIVLATGAVAAVAAGPGLPVRGPADDDLTPAPPPDRPLGAADLRAVRFPVVARGYRMDQVDALLDRLAAQLGQPGPHEADPEAPAAHGADEPGGPAPLGAPSPGLPAVPPARPFVSPAPDGAEAPHPHP